MSDLIIKGAGEIKDGLYNIKDGKLFKYKANGGTVRTYPIVSADRPKWIPCSERLPEEHETVLITVRGHDVIRMQEGETLEQALERTYNSVCYTSVGFIGSDGWYGADGYPQMIRPVAWMPLPDAYKESEE